MRLTFEGHSIVERGFNGVKFVGRYSDMQRRERYVACYVTREALEKLAGAPILVDEELLQAYISNSELINRLATAQHSGGIEKPVVTMCDMAHAQEIKPSKNYDLSASS